MNTLSFQQRDVREVYYLCLAMGFMGRNCNKGDETLLEQLKTSNLKLLMGSSVGIPSLENAELFPEANPKDTAGRVAPQRKSGLPLFTLLCLGGPVFVFGLLFFIYRFALNGMAENLLK